jgi:protein-S-isoprenylcysteine O-methyltransferase
MISVAVLLAVVGTGFLVSELALARSRRSANEQQADARDRGSLRVLWLVIGVAIAAGLSLAHLGPSLPGWPIWPGVGAAVFAIGAALRWWAIRHLGRFFTVDVAVARDHRVVDDGPYRYVRHPSYSGLLLEFLGFALIPGMLVPVLVILLPTFVALWYRIRVEEEALRAHLGEDYVEYMRRTKRLVPGLF